MSKEIFVTLGQSHIPVGRLIFEGRRKPHSTFIYSDEWLENDLGFDLSPDMPRSKTPYHASLNGSTDLGHDAMDGSFTDTMPDKWGRGIMRAAYGRGMNEFDFLTLINDKNRHGSLRFRDKDGKPIQSGVLVIIPRINHLENLREKVEKYESDDGNIQDNAIDIIGATASLGGARPKASIIDTDGEWIAKFTSIRDTWPVERLEIATLEMARIAGIRVPKTRLALSNSDRPVALLKRFDRNGETRLPFISARTALSKKGKEKGYYTDIVDIMHKISVYPEKDIPEIWQRLIFTILVTNRDDHLKNHGFIYGGENKWRLSPMFDVNPQPRRSPCLETGISDIHGFEPSLEAAIDAAPLFDIENDDAKRIAGRMGKIIKDNWSFILQEQGITGDMLKKCAPAFEHERLEKALSFSSNDHPSGYLV